MPERIFATGGHYWPNPTFKRDKTEYIRADLVPQWMPIETAPKDKRILVIQTQNNIIQVARGFNEYGDWKTGSGPMDYIVAVTHWQPLPTPPPAT